MMSTNVWSICTIASGFRDRGVSTTAASTFGTNCRAKDHLVPDPEVERRSRAGWACRAAPFALL